MPLTIKVKPNEVIYLNGGILRNAGSAASLLFETPVRFLRGGDVIREADADTPLKKLYLTLTMIYLDENAEAATELFYRQSAEIARLQPHHAPALLEIRDRLDEKEFYKAMKACRHAIRFESPD